MPISELTTRISPNSPSASDPAIRTITNSAPRMALNRVKTLALTISQMDREDRFSVALV